MKTSELFGTVHTEGGLLPGDLLKRIYQGDSDLPGLDPGSYHLAGGERLNEAIARSWNRLVGAWQSFKSSSDKLPERDAGTTLTRERWLLVLFQELGYGRLTASRSFDIEGKTYAVSHRWGPSPIHLVSFRVDLGKRLRGVAGAASGSPHSLVQEFLNRSEDHLWGFVSNGFALRILRDNSSLTRQAYLEFDLEQMMEGEVYADFAVLWLICHQSRVESEDGRPETCWLERWTRLAQEQGVRALDRLRRGFERAIVELGAGFLAHPSNADLRRRLRSGELSTPEYYRRLLRLVYRLIFLFVAEDRGLLFDPEAGEEATRRYSSFYSTARLRRLAEHSRGTKHCDLYRSLSVVMGKLGTDDGCPELGLAPLGGFLWSAEAIGELGASDISNRRLLAAVHALAFAEVDGIPRSVDYKNLGSEELGSVYESLLELHPEINTEAASFELAVASGHERKTTGSYYTPSSLIQRLLDSALDPVLEEAASGDDPEEAILSLKVCDPACGSGHFLIAAAHRMAKRLATIRTGDEEPAPDATTNALRDVIGSCIYGVDVNPMAVELCKVGLWMEALEKGKPLSFLDHRILCGNSLLGAAPALIAEGIPDDAFKPIEGDDKRVAAAFKKQNREERKGQISLYGTLVAEPAARYEALAVEVEGLDSLNDSSIVGIRRKEKRFRGILESGDYKAAKLIADAWCASFVWKKDKATRIAVTHDLFLRLRSDPESAPPDVLREIEGLARSYRFFHWHLAFPDVFRAPGAAGPENRHAGWDGGFDVVLGNPPWERVKLQEKEWFATRAPDIAAAPNAAARRRLIKGLEQDDPDLYLSFMEARRMAEGESHLVRDSGRYPLCGRGDVNTYTIFAETKRAIICPKGRVGCIVPSGIATDDTTKFFFQDLMDSGALVSLYDFENRHGIFPGVHRSYKFCLLTMTGDARPVKEGAEFAFFLHATDELVDEERRFTLSSEDLSLLNPNTRTCPIFRTRRDAEITKGIYRRVPVLIREGPPEENPWGIRFMAMLHMANDSGLFRTREELEAEGWMLVGNVFRRGPGEGEGPGGAAGLTGSARRSFAGTEAQASGRREDTGDDSGTGASSHSISPGPGPDSAASVPDRDIYLPLYEAKMIHHYNHRFGDYADLPRGSKSTQLPDVPVSRLQDPGYMPLPRYWVPKAEVDARLAGKWNRGWLMGWRDICRSTDERTVIASVLPRVGVGHTYPLLFTDAGYGGAPVLLLSNLTSFVFDFVARQKVGGTHLTYGYLNQLTALAPASYEPSSVWVTKRKIGQWLLPRAIELFYTSWDLAPLAADCGYEGPPFRWDAGRRFLIRCEIDAAFFHLYGIPREDVDYIMETFPIVKRNDLKHHDTYRTKDTILEIFDKIREAIETGRPYVTPIDPPPGDESMRHTSRERAGNKG